MKKKINKSNLKGLIAIASNATGYISVADLEEDVKIEQSFLNTALHGDEVEIALFPKIPGERLTGEVIKIIKRAKTEFVGTVDKRKGSSVSFVVPDDKRMYTDIFLSQNESKKVQNGLKILVEIKKWDDPKKSPEGKILKTIGKQGDHNTEMKSIVLGKGFEIDFPPKVKREAELLEKAAKLTFDEEISKRKDLRNINTYTIDPHDAKDLDDAISFKEISKNLFEIGINIADVSHYVKAGSYIDKEAKERGTSIYLVDRTIPMLPEILSNNICSLNPGEDKLTFSAILTITSDGTIKDRWFGRTVINPDKRFSYEEAEAALNDKNNKYHNELSQINKLAKIFNKERMKMGAIDFESNEVKFELDSKGKPINIKIKERLDAHKLIEEFMVLANKEVASYLSKDIKKIKKGASIYRTHGAPKRESIAELLFLLKTLGHEIEIEEKDISSKELNKLFDMIENTPEESLVKTVALKSMAKAIYSTKNTGHYGLAIADYTHFTSPIRRYADVLLHRILDKHLNGKNLNKEEIDEYHSTAIELSAREVDATEAERASITYKQVEYMLERVGEEFTGIITGITNWGVYVEESKTKSSGMVKFRDMKDDFYTFDRETYSIIGEKTKNKYSIGDEVKIKVLGGDLIKKTLDYAFV